MIPSLEIMLPLKPIWKVSNELFTFLTLIFVNHLCALELPQYIRGEIMKISLNKGQVVVEMLDFHGEMLVSMENIFYLPEASLCFAPQCFDVELQGRFYCETY